jgi:fructose-1,6-bisphosphatase/inositol monophosphatase family enzyme
MILNANELDSLTELAIEAATKAGAYIQGFSGDDVTRIAKDAGDTEATQVVTEVDFKSQEIILETLEQSLVKFNLALLTEEATDDKERFEKDYFWCIDPLDGTLPFTEGKPGYAVSIALVSKSGEAFIGVVYDPVKDTLYSAAKGKGAYRNKKPWKIFESQSNEFVFIYNRSFLSLDFFPEVVQDLEHLSERMGHQKFTKQIYGGAALNACSMLENVPACFFAFPKKQEGGGSLWDYAATACICNELGGYVSDMYGNPVELNRKSSTFLNHKGILYSTSKEIAESIIQMYATKYA